ncbi:MAG: flagellar basal body rod C-terminal domain-containing protein [Syntrophobacteraceae bacterium]
MRIESSLMNAYSGMVTAASAQQVTSNNVANANTPSYKAQQAVITENTNGGASVSGVTADSSEGSAIQSIGGEGAYEYIESSNVDLGKEMVNTAMQKAAYEANANSLKVSDQMMQQTVNLVA